MQLDIDIEDWPAGELEALATRAAVLRLPGSRLVGLAVARDRAVASS
jgi:hypothetical protein